MGLCASASNDEMIQTGVRLHVRNGKSDTEDPTSARLVACRQHEPQNDHATDWKCRVVSNNPICLLQIAYLLATSSPAPVPSASQGHVSSGGKHQSTEFVTAKSDHVDTQNTQASASLAELRRERAFLKQVLPLEMPEYEGRLGHRAVDLTDSGAKSFDEVNPACSDNDSALPNGQKRGGRGRVGLLLPTAMDRTGEAGSLMGLKRTTATAMSATAGSFMSGGGSFLGTSSGGGRPEGEHVSKRLGEISHGPAFTSYCYHSSEDPIEVEESGKKKPYRPRPFRNRGSASNAAGQLVGEQERDEEEDRETVAQPTGATDLVAGGIPGSTRRRLTRKGGAAGAALECYNGQVQSGGGVLSLLASRNSGSMTNGSCGAGEASAMRRSMLRGSFLGESFSRGRSTERPNGSGGRFGAGDGDVFDGVVDLTGGVGDTAAMMDEQGSVGIGGTGSSSTPNSRSGGRGRGRGSVGSSAEHHNAMHVQVGASIRQMVRDQARLQSAGVVDGGDMGTVSAGLEPAGASFMTGAGLDVDRDRDGTAGPGTMESMKREVTQLREQYRRHQAGVRGEDVDRRRDDDWSAGHEQEQERAMTASWSSLESD